MAACPAYFLTSQTIGNVYIFPVIATYINVVNTSVMLSLSVAYSYSPEYISMVNSFQPCFLNMCPGMRKQGLCAHKI